MRCHIASYEWCGCTSDEQYLCWRSPLYIHNCARSSSIFTSIETGEGELRKAGWWIGELDVMWCDDVRCSTPRAQRTACACAGDAETQRRATQHTDCLQHACCRVWVHNYISYCYPLHPFPIQISYQYQYQYQYLYSPFASSIFPSWSINSFPPTSLLC